MGRLIIYGALLCAFIAVAVSAVAAHRPDQSPPGTGEKSQVSAQDLTGLIGRLKTRVTSAPIFHRPYPGSRAVSTQSATYRDSENGTVVWWKLSEQQTLRKPAVPLTEAAFQATANAFLNEHKERLGLREPLRELQLKRTEIDRLGMAHLKYQQCYRDIPVWGSEVVVHLNSSGQVTLINGRYNATPTLDNVTPQVTAQDAIDIAQRDFEYEHPGISLLPVKSTPAIAALLPESQATLTIFHSESGEAALAWQVEYRPNPYINWRYFVNATNGAVLFKYDNLQSDGPAVGTALDLFDSLRTVHSFLFNGFYYPIDASRPMYNPNTGTGTIQTFSNRFYATLDSIVYPVTLNPNNWPDKTLVSAHYNAGVVYDYYLNTHGRNSIDGNGGSMYSIIHHDISLNNAFWDGRFMIFGDGDGVTFSPLAGALDVTAHEMTHGVVQHTANLIYLSQSGALNESFADVFGAMVDREDWLMGEDVYTPGISGDALRDLSNPERFNQPAHMDDFEFRPISEDNGGVHTYSGIPNRAAFLIANAIGRDKTEQIYYRALTIYLTSRSQFIDARRALIQSATDLYPSETPTIQAVRAAFDAVGILDGAATPPETPVPPPAGEERILFVKADSTLWIMNPDGSALHRLTTTKVIARPAITADGHTIGFVDRDNNLRAINTDGTDEEVIVPGNLTRAFALAPSGTKAALLTTAFDPTIIVVEVVDDSAVVSEIELYSPTYNEDLFGPAPRYADALDFSYDGERLIYDALNEAAEFDSFWDINEILFEEALIIPFLPPRPIGIDVGNPAYASTVRGTVVFEEIDASQVHRIKVFDRTQNTIETLVQNGSRPDFSPDDSKLIFQSLETTPILYTINTDGTNLQSLSIAGSNPVWFVEAFQAQLSANMTLIDFGTVDTGTVKDSTLTITNTGMDTLRTTNITVTNPAFSFSVMDLVIPPGQSGVGLVAFAPTAGGDFSGAIVIESNAPTSPDSIRLQGVGFTKTLAIPSDTSTVEFVSQDSIRATVKFTSGQVSGNTVTFESYGVTPPPSVQTVPPFDKAIFYVDLNTTIPDSVAFEATITMGYTDSYLATIGISDEANPTESLAVAWFNPANSTWNLIAANINTALNTVSFTTDHFSVWALAFTGPTGIEENRYTGIPEMFALKQNYPNPFNPSTIIEYDVPQQAHITLTVYNLLGQEVVRLVDGVKSPGRYIIRWNGRNSRGTSIASGVYLYRLESAGFSQTKRMTLMK